MPDTSNDLKSNAEIRKTRQTMPESPNDLKQRIRDALMAGRWIDPDDGTVAKYIPPKDPNEWHEIVHVSADALICDLLPVFQDGNN